MRYASNTPISGPVAITHKADVDFNGLQWSYDVGLMFPSSAAMNKIPTTLPHPIAQPRSR